MELLLVNNLKQAKQRILLKKIKVKKLHLDQFYSQKKMKYKFTPAKNPRVLIIQKVYGQIINNDQKIFLKNIDLKNL